MAVTKIPKKTVTLIEPKRSFLVDKEKHRQKRVAAYCRVSTDDEEQLTSYTNQKKVYNKEEHRQRIREMLRQKTQGGKDYEKTCKHSENLEHRAN